MSSKRFPKKGGLRAGQERRQLRVRRGPSIIFPSSPLHFSFRFPFKRRFGRSFACWILIPVIFQKKKKAFLQFLRLAGGGVGWAVLGVLSMNALFRWEKELEGLVATDAVLLCIFGLFLSAEQPVVGVSGVLAVVFFGIWMGNVGERYFFFLETLCEFWMRTKCPLKRGRFEGNPQKQRVKWQPERKRKKKVLDPQGRRQERGIFFSSNFKLLPASLVPSFCPRALLEAFCRP